MTATGHAIIGTVIAAKIGNPAIALPLAVLSHFAADAVPHWDTATNIKSKGRQRVIIESFFDVVFSFVLSYVLIVTVFPNTNLTFAFLAIIAAQLPDWLMSPYYFFDIDAFPFNWAYRFQKQFDNRMDKPWGIINQVAILVSIVALAKIF